MKSFLNALLGMGALAALVLCAIGAIGFMLSEGRFLFSIATAVVIIFAAKPMYKFIQTKLL